MRHRSNTKALNRPAAHRQLMVRNLLTSLFLHKSLRTTDARAKVLVSQAEKLINNVREKDEVSAIRYLNSIFTQDAASRSALELSKKESLPKTGIVRSARVGYRAGDGALLMQVEIIQS